MVRIGSLLSVGGDWPAESFESSGGQEPDQELRVTAIHDPPYLFIHRQPDGSYRYDGYLYQLWQIVTRELDLRYQIVPLARGGYGSLTENGTWIGMVGELAYGRADVALTGLVARPDRKAVVDFIDSVAVVQDQSTLYIRKSSEGIPEIGPDMFNSLLRPLDMDVWWMLLASLLVMSVLIRASMLFNHARAEKKQTVDDMTWGSCLLSTFMSMVGQSWSRTPSSLAARTVTLFCWILGILVYTNYTANLISHLTVATVDRPIKSLREFAEQPDWLLAIEPGYAVLNDWKKSRDSYEQKLYRRTITGEGYIRLNVTGESVRRITQEKVMTFIDFGRLLNLVGQEACHLVPLLNDLPEKTDAYMAIAKENAEMRRAINEIMQKLNQAGIIRRLKKSWLKTGKDMCDRSKNFKELSFADLLAVLILVPIAFVSSVIIFALEWMFSKAKSSDHQRSPPSLASLVGCGKNIEHTHQSKRKPRRVIWRKKRRMWIHSLKAS